MITMLGFLILLGTVVNNPILIVDEMRHRLNDRGLDPRVAVRGAVDSRLRPVLMSTITTLFGLAPLVFLPGAGTELYRGLGAIVLFGLLFAMIVTLVFLPPLLVTLLELRPLLLRCGEALGWRKPESTRSLQAPPRGDASPAEGARTSAGPHHHAGQP
jgi:Cu/Ag efflux pump CusA